MNKKTNRYLTVFFAIFILNISNSAYGQNEFFHELALEKALRENEKWEFIGEANWKHLYNEPGWRRWGVSFAGVRKIKRFRLSAGANGYYTFNSSITNFFEVRPWTALQLKIPIAGGVALQQKLQYEWRFFYAVGNLTTNENYARLRYQIGLDIPVSVEGEPSWKIRPSFEWFFIRDPATFERFSNERDYGLTLTKRLKHEHALSLSYKIEEFYELHTSRVYGHIFGLSFTF